MKCNQCKNPVTETDIICQWCGAELIMYSSQDENHPIKKLQDDLLAIEQNVREKVQLKLDNKNNNLSTFDKIFGTKPDFDWDEDLENQAIQKITRSQAKFINTYILPSNPKVLEELLEIALSEIGWDSVDNLSKEFSRSKLATTVDFLSPGLITPISSFIQQKSQGEQLTDLS